MSQQLRDRVGMGTLGAAKASESWAKPELAENNKIIARGRKTQDVNRAVDTILASATRLEKEIELETKYWSQVLALSDQGWNVCRVPRRKGILGVKLGSSESMFSLDLLWTMLTNYSYSGVAKSGFGCFETHGYWCRGPGKSADGRAKSFASSNTSRRSRYRLLENCRTHTIHGHLSTSCTSPSTKYPVRPGTVA